MPQPKLSIIMGAYNCAHLVHRAIESVQQQSFTQWEFVICEDGSSDHTWERLQELAKSDQRLVLLRNDKNQGLAASLNRCIAAAQAPYLVRQDADDLSLPGRLQTLFQYLETHPEVSVVGSYGPLFEEPNAPWGVLKRPLTASPAQWLIGPQVIHASAAMVRSHIVEAGGYDASQIRIEDYDLFMRLLGQGRRIVTIPKELYAIHWSRGDYGRRKLQHNIGSFKIALAGWRRLQLPLPYIAIALKPVLVGLVPNWVIYLIHRCRFSLSARLSQRQG